MKRVNSLEDFAARLLWMLRGGHGLAKPLAADAISPEWGCLFDELALELFGLQLEHNGAYRRLCGSRGIQSAEIGNCGQIPAVPTSAFKEFEFSCIASQERTSVFFSSGTTQQRPSRHFHNHKSLEVYESSVLAWFEFAFGDSRPKSGLALTPRGLEAPNSSLVHMFETLHRNAGFERFVFTGRIGNEGSWALDCPDTIHRIEEAICNEEPVLLLGTAFSYVHLLDYLAHHNLSFRLPTGSKVLETGGYKGRSRVVAKSELQMLISRFLGVPSGEIVSEYGMSELSSQGYAGIWRDGGQEKQANAFHLPPWAKAQVVSPETGQEVDEGEKGLLRIFDLANVYSVMALQTEDLAIRRAGGFELLGRVTVSEPRGCSLMALG